MAIAGDALAVAQRLGQGLPQNDTAVFGGVVIIESLAAESEAVDGEVGVDSLSSSEVFMCQSS